MTIAEYQQKIITLTAKLERKSRDDKGKKRTKYDSTLPKHYKEYLKRANRKGLRFEITVAQFDTIKQMDCVYCGAPASGMDRISSSEGYVEGNVQPCCYMCNMMKMAHTEDKFLQQIIRICRYRNIMQRDKLTQS